MEDPIRILFINPNSDQHTCELIQQTISRFPQDNCHTDVTFLKTAPKLISGYEDRVVAAGELTQLLRENEDHYDAFVLACHADPNLDLAREVSAKPVIGIAEASMKIASSMGNGFAVISPNPKAQSAKYALVHKYYLDPFLKGVVVSNSDTPEDLLAAAREAAKIPCVDTIVLGCANYTGADAFVEKYLGLPVIDGVACALFLAYSLARYNRYKVKV